jgi:hypothetical protein
MYVLTIQLLIDFGLLILIWMVQLIAYPSFQYMNSNQLATWHARYTPRITSLVAPLMLLQLVIAIYSMYLDINIHTILYAVLVVAMWVFTLKTFIPLHDKIKQGYESVKLLEKLVYLNGYRTAVWTVTFLLSLARLCY